METIKGLNKDMLRYHESYLEKQTLIVEAGVEKSRKKHPHTQDPAYTVYGFAIALQIWAYEVIISLIPRYVAKLFLGKEKRPRILLYEGIRRNTSIEVSKTLNSSKICVLRNMKYNEEELKIYNIDEEEYTFPTSEEEKDEKEGEEKKDDEEEKEEDEEKKEKKKVKVENVRVEEKVRVEMEEKVRVEMEDLKKEMKAKVGKLRTEIVTPIFSKTEPTNIGAT